MVEPGRMRTRDYCNPGSNIALPPTRPAEMGGLENGDAWVLWRVAAQTCPPAGKHVGGLTPYRPEDYSAP